MDNLALEQDKVLARLERAGIQGECGPKLNPEREDAYWLAKPGAPKPRLENEKPQGETVAYDQLIKAWRDGRAR
jgi:glycerol transport system substrate-binding protein